jgi:hypothetical protein
MSQGVHGWVRAPPHHLLWPLYIYPVAGVQEKGVPFPEGCLDGL